MSKVKIPRKSVSLDMTAMCDMAFLLLTFFILTAKFKPDDPVVVDTPASISDVKLPDANIMTISIDRQDKVYFGIDGQFDREKMLEFVAGKYKVGFTPEEIKQFSLLSSFGVPVGNMRQLLATKDKSKIQQPGIPCDSANNELTDWIAYARYANPKLRITIKGDVNSSYQVVGQVIKTLQDQNINKFNLITDLKAKPKTL
ncbi:MAG TPA: biopolymer transporter ExbD [Catalimonadaceae bacterium]|nr:biopolymer transporter ExbD [Catalimonadaceae bacterium]HPI11422.1 biopolymer transporter ExbD [Catalimonadaceae bacterium]